VNIFLNYKRLEQVFKIKDFLSTRRFILGEFEIDKNFKNLEESCIPSYAHSNILLSWVAWLRLNKAVQLWDSFGAKRVILDFGAGSGVLKWLLDDKVDYHFCEIDENLASFIAGRFPSSKRILDLSLSKQQFDVVFALDSLEHNEDVVLHLKRIKDSIKDDGLFILSGPTENLLYRFGRYLAGFQGGYHFQTIYDIEKEARAHFRLLKKVKLPFGVSIFRISVWAPH